MPPRSFSASFRRAALTHISVAFLLGTALLCSVSTEALRIAIVSSGDWHALLRVSALVDAAQLPNHTVAVLVDSKGYHACGDILTLPACEPLPCGRTGCNAHVGTPLPRLLLSALQQRRFRPDVVVADAFFDEVDRAAEELNVPMVVLAGAARDLAAVQYGTVPYWRAGATRVGSFTTAMASAALGFVRSFGELSGSRLPRDVRLRSHTIVEGVPGIDLVTPLCPNVHPAGILHTQGDPVPLRVSEDLDGWVRGCGDRLFYASSLLNGTLPPHSIHSFLQALSHSSGACVLWHALTSASVATSPRKDPEDARVKVTADVLASPFHVLRRYKPLAVLSSSPQSVLHDAIVAQTPILYIGNSSAQCSLLRDAGVGGCTASLFASDVTTAMETVSSNSTVLERLRSARRLTFLMGGAHKAVEVVELATALGRANTDFVCSQNLIVSPYGYDAVQALCASIVLSLLCASLLPLCALVRWRARGRATPLEKH